MEWFHFALDLVLIVLISVGLYQATRLIRHLAGLRQGRLEMERFIHEFSTTVTRAEAGIKGLRQAARESGDDLEKLVEKAALIRDELQFLVESADQMAERLSATASQAVRSEAAPARSRGDAARETPVLPEQLSAENAKPVSKHQNDRKEPAAATPPSRAEKELLQALQKLS